MLTHKHALISLGYAGGLGFFAGQGASDPYVYLFALIGGEVIDFVDHPLYHLFYRRKERHVVQARKLLFTKGLRRAVAYLKRVEDQRKFSGLILHNIFALELIAAVALILALFVPAPTYLFVAAGAFLLHMLMDIAGDFYILGHADNWLWVIPQHWKTALRATANRSRVSSRSCIFVLPWLWVPMIGFVLTSVRAGWQLANPGAFAGLYVAAKHANWLWLVGIALLLLIFYVFWIFIVCLAAVRKHTLDTRNRVQFSLGSLSLLWRFITGKVQRTRANADRVYLRVGSDCAVWSLIGISLTASTLLALTWLDSTNELLFFLTPVFFALMFGTLVHTSVGELSGGFGVIIGWTLNTILARLNFQEFWPLRRGFLLFLAAVVAWAVGLLGAVFLRGLSRMSIVAFVVEFSTRKESFAGDTRAILAVVSRALEKGYKTAHHTLLGHPPPDFLRRDPPNLLLEPYVGYAIWGTSPFHFRATDSYCPIIRETAYTLCDNSLTAASGGRMFLPVMPRQRTLDGESADVRCSQTTIRENDRTLTERQFHWQSRKRSINLVGPVFLGEHNQRLPSEKLNKTWPEFIDNFLTRQSTVITDLFVYPPSDSEDSITICGLVRERTSTKEYATVESEVYAGCVMNELVALHKDAKLVMTTCKSARLVYPRVSIFDESPVRMAENSAALLSPLSIITNYQVNTIDDCLKKLSPGKVLPYATADFGKKLALFALELSLTTLIVAFGFNPELVQRFLNAIVGYLR